MDAFRGSDVRLITTADLAAREDFRLGEAVISPPTRTIVGPGGSVGVEPRVMQVLVVLADSAGHVVTRNTLFQSCWGGVYVGDDSLNRVVAGVRKLASEIAGGSFAVETVPRTGYRLTVLRGAAPRTNVGVGAVSAGTSRRRMIAGGVAAVAAVGGLGLWSASQFRRDAQFDDLIERAEAAVRNGSAFADDRAVRILQEAISIRPDSAKAWGLLALLKSVVAQSADPKSVARAVEEAEKAARRALALDPDEPNALLAMFELQGSTLDWATRDQRLRQIISLDPRNILAIAELVLLLQAAGLNHESWNWNERALAIEPLSVDFLSKRALKLWILGRISQADKVIDQVRALYPTNPWPSWVRFLILALTGRPRAAQAMLDTDPAMVGTPTEASFWRTCLVALDRRSPETIARARDACVNGAKALSAIPGQAVMILSALGEVDTAFDVCNGFLLSRGSIVHQGEPGSKDAINDAAARINAQWLFTPPAASMRADARFLPLCDAMGLGDYWRQRGVRPDYLLQRT